MAKVTVIPEYQTSIVHPVLVNKPNVLAEGLRNCPNCHDKGYVTRPEDGDRFIALPAVKNAPYRVLYDLEEFSPLMDSSCMGMCDWQHIAKEVGVSLAFNLKIY